ncbi:hypothetical protein ML5_0836 [Micromonospora sp. L5]|uniref:hypothetical protein n=1 Tax=Micromonospora TaxID=1873 RepID=UPI0001C45853|nr:hypothetical protein [Micromonospora sp. L5]ADU06381.1 hypothetical protein ML5_0836 [Micromonospora sp. L5]
MERMTFAGMQILQLTDAEADQLVAGGLTPPDDVNMIQTAVRYPADQLRPMFDTKPTWISWVSPIPDGRASLLSAQSGRERRRSRQALAAFDGLDIRFHPTIEAEVFDPWLTIYTSMVDGMEQGLNIARDSRDEILAPDSPHRMATVHRDGRLVGGWVMYDMPDFDIFRMRFAAFEPALRDLGAARAAILVTADWARDRGRALFSLGNDINFYSKLLKPGLQHFKVRLGFRPTPTHLLNDVGEMVCERVVNLAGLSSLALAYLDDDPTPSATALDYLDGTCCLQLNAYVEDGAEVDLSLYDVDPHRVHFIPRRADQR